MRQLCRLTGALGNALMGQRARRNPTGSMFVFAEQGLSRFVIFL